MIRIILFSFYLFITAYALHGQKNFHVSKQYATQQGIFNKEVRPTVLIRNLRNKPMQLKWQVKRAQLTPGWDAVVCDKTCHTTRELSGSFTLAPYEVLHDFSVSFRPNGKEGLSNVDVSIFEADNPKKSKQEITFNASGISNLSAREKLNKSPLGIYPNPAVQHIKINDTQGDVKYLEVYNIMGRKMLNFHVKHIDEKFDISSLPRGMYMIRLLNEHKKALKTQRISKYNP